MKLIVHSKNQVRLGNHVKRGTQRGFSLIEMTFAVAILAIVGGALVSMGLTTVKMTTSAKLKTQATALAHERIEQLKACRDRDNLLPGDAGWSCPGLGLGPPLSDIFDRIETISVAGDEATATVTVSWHGGTKEVRLQTILSDWKAREATGQ